MIRFRNPGTEFSTQIQVIKELYNSLSNNKSFSLNDMADVIAKSRLMTAYGYAGQQAIELSNTEQESLNSAKMNAKMYAEVFRMLGWVTPFSSNSSYPLVFTYIGAHIAMSENDCSELYEQCVLGINNPTQLTNNMSYSEKIRFFKCALRTLIDLDGIMYKHELCLGPMCIDDCDEIQYQNMLTKIKNLRGNINNLKCAFKGLANSLGMKETPVDNCTRLPIALMKSCGWIESVRNKSLYGKTMTCIKITEHGRQIYKEIKNMADIRLDFYEKCNEETKMSLIRLGVYRMLIRSGYDLGGVFEVIKKDMEVCKNILDGKDILFSPCQTIRRDEVEKALGISRKHEEQNSRSIISLSGIKKQKKEKHTIYNFDINIENKGKNELLNDPLAVKFLNQVDDLKKKEFTSSQIVDELFKLFRYSTQNTFYPLVSTLFRIIGLNCHYSRTGDNGSRWDAIIEDDNRSIPIEIKSPTEEEHLSIKAIRQSLENKIILLSRKTFCTDKDTTSLAVGYYLPNERAEVAELILNIKKTFGYKIGVLDFHSLLSIAISVLVDGKGIDLEKIYNLEGLSSANI